LNESDCSINDIDEEENIFGQLKHLLQNAKEIGDTSFSDEASQLPVYSGLDIDNFGIVFLPFSSDSAQKMKDINKKLSNYNDASTNVFQLEPSSFKINNPEWNEGLKKLVNQTVAKGLGCHGEVEAKLYKFLVYQPGGHFKKVFFFKPNFSHSNN
jgi:hypothetical protein